jgi:dihydropteroate synthase
VDSFIADGFSQPDVNHQPPHKTAAAKIFKAGIKFIAEIYSHPANVQNYFHRHSVCEFAFLAYDSPMLLLEQLASLLEQNRAAAAARVQEFSIGERKFKFNSEPAIMGVVNLSADSWYRESVCLSADAAIQRGQVLAAQGAAIIDVGAESTLAHAARVDDAGQNSKLIPVIKALRAEKILVSIETYQPAVTRACLEAGANVLNLTGTEASDEIFRMVADHDAAVIICYVAGKNVREVGDFDLSADPIPLLRNFFARQIEAAHRNGVEKIFLDPGLGFYYKNLQDSAVRVRHQMNVFLNTFRLREYGFPICHALPHAFEFFGDEVRSAEPFFAVLAALGKTDLYRTHEVPRTKAVLETLKVF